MYKKNKVNLFLDKFDNVVSLGRTCATKMFLKSINPEKYKETQFFDWIGSHIYFINKLIENDFNNVLDYDKFMLITKNNYVYNYLYCLVFFHDFDKKQNIMMEKNDEKWISFEEKYKRRIQKFNNILNSNLNILFIREERKIEEEQYSFSEDAYNEDEYISLINFSNIIKKKYPSLNFHILLMSRTKNTNYDKENNIIIINGYISDDWKMYDQSITNILYKNIDFLIEIYN